LPPHPTGPAFESNELAALFNSVFFGNLLALAAGGGTSLADRLIASNPFELPTSEVTVSLAADLSPILTVDSAAQDSRRGPLAEATNFWGLKLASRPVGSEVWLLGLSSPATIAIALSHLEHLTVFESDPMVIRAFLGSRDWRSELASRALTVVTPQDLALAPPRPSSPYLIEHRPSVRRQPVALAGLERFLFGASKLLLDQNQQPSILIVPPFSGGSEPMGGCLARAASELTLRHQLLDWPLELRRQAEELKTTPEARPARELMAASAALVARLASDFKPSIILALAQAPLDAKGLSQIRYTVPESWLAFWFVEDFQRFGYVNEVAPAYDLFFHIQGDLLIDRIKQWGLSKTWYLPAAADSSIFSPGEPHEDFRARVSMMGAGYPNRRRLLGTLARHWMKTGRPIGDFKIFGSGWSSSPPELTPHLFAQSRRVDQTECAMIYRSTDINLNIHSGDGLGFDELGAFVNPRTFEVAAGGNFQITDQRPLLNDLFPSGQIFTLDRPEDLIPATEECLANPQLRMDMAKAARNTVLRRHLYRHRLQTILALAQRQKWD
jgi:spore maturation protein CgeB